MSKEDKNRIGIVIKQAFNTETWELIEKVTKGMTPSSIYRVRVGAIEYIVKISDPNHPFNNLDREFESTRIAGENEVGPKVFYSDAKAGIILMEYIDSSSLNFKDLAKPEMVEKLSNFIKQVHSSKRFRDELLVFKRIDMVYSALPDYIKAQEMVAKSMVLKDDIIPHLLDKDDLRPSHADINPHNVLFNGVDFKLIDWATAAQESFYFDLATCMTFLYPANPEISDDFLSKYFGRKLSRLESFKYDEMMKFVNIYYGIMFLFIGARKNTDYHLSDEEILGLPSYLEFVKDIENGNANLSNYRDLLKMGYIFLQKNQVEKFRAKL